MIGVYTTVHRFLVTAFALAAAQTASLKPVLDRMDASAAGFRSLTANIARVQYTAIIDDKSEDGGNVSLLKTKGKDVRALVEITRPAPRALALNEHKAEVFNPKANTIQEIDLGKQKGMVDQFLLLGFGVGSKELAKNYAIKYVAEEAVAGQKASKLELTPKSGDVLRHVKKIELWVSDPHGYPVQHKFIEPSGNYWLYTWSNVKLNPGLKPEQLQIKAPPNVKREYPQR
ncbi:MAG: hypothetical protein U0Q16_35185 [Bryobacteraceae bacterium]